MNLRVNFVFEWTLTVYNKIVLYYMYVIGIGSKAPSDWMGDETYGAQPGCTQDLLS